MPWPQQFSLRVCFRAVWGIWLIINQPNIFWLQQFFIQKLLYIKRFIKTILPIVWRYILVIIYSLSLFVQQRNEVCQDTRLKNILINMFYDLYTSIRLYNFDGVEKYAADYYIRYPISNYHQPRVYPIPIFFVLDLYCLVSLLFTFLYFVYVPCSPRPDPRP